MIPTWPSPLTWLGGAGLNSLSPTDPRIGSSALSPTDPRGPHQSVESPTDPRIKGGLPKIGGWPQPSPAPLPRNDIDPPWLYADPDVLLAQALRKSRAKIVRPSDVLLPLPQIQQAALRGRPLQGTHLWRWEPEFRVRAIACDLLARFQVYGRSVWVLDAHWVPGKLQLQTTEVFTLGNVKGLNRDDQVDKVLRAAIEREDRLPEILSQMNDFWPFFESLIGIPLGGAPRLQELLAVTSDFALHLLMAFKHECAVRRPVQESSLVAPVISTPGHGSMPSGHATIAAFNAEMLCTLLYRSDPVRAEQLDRLARRIAFNRVVAGVHFPMDSQAGYALGTQLARLVATLAGEADPPPAPLDAHDVFVPTFELREVGHRPAPRPGHYQLEPVATLRALWQQTQAELDLMRV